MTLTKDQSSNKEWLESISNTDLEKVIRRAMEEGCIHPAHVFDAVDEALDRLAKIEVLVKSIDLTQCSPLPWKCRAGNKPIADTGDVEGYCLVEDAKKNTIACTYADDEEHEIEKDDGWVYHADMLAIADAVNAVSEIKKILTPHKKG